MTNSIIPMPGFEENNRPSARGSLSALVPASVLGLYAFAAATFLVAARMTQWYGNTQSALILFPLVLIFGLAQFYAGTWAFRSRDAVSLAMHGIWGVFWTAYGILEILISSGRVVRPTGSFPELGFWFIPVALITWAILVASRKSRGMLSLLVLVAIGATLEAIAELAGLGGSSHPGRVFPDCLGDRGLVPGERADAAVREDCEDTGNANGPGRDPARRMRTIPLALVLRHSALQFLAKQGRKHSEGEAKDGSRRGRAEWIDPCDGVCHQKARRAAWLM